MKCLAVLLCLISSKMMFGSMPLKDSVRIEKLDSITFIYRRMTYNRGVFLSIVTNENKITRLSISGNAFNEEYTCPDINDSTLKRSIIYCGIHYDSLVFLIRLMTKNKHCSVGLTGNPNNYSIHVGYKLNLLTGREFSYVFIDDEKEKIIADRNNRYVKLKEGIYKTSGIER